MKAAHVLAVTLATAFAFAAPSAASAQPAERTLAPVFPWEATIDVDRAGVHRVPLDEAVLERSRGDLSDVRIFDARGREVPFLVESAVPERAPIADVELAPVSVTREHRGRLGRTESYVVDLPAPAPGVVGWDLLVRVSAARFVARAVVEELGSDGQVLRVLHDGTVFRLPPPQHELLRIPLCASTRVRLRLDSENGFFLEPGLHATATRDRPPSEWLTVPLAIRRVRHELGRTRIVVARPSGLVPQSVRIDTRTRTFHRDIEIHELGPGGERRAIARGAIQRVLELPDAEELELAIGPARSDELEIAIEDGDAPPLDAVTVVALAPKPCLVGDLRGPATLRFGGGRAHLPRYDLAGLVPSGEARRLLETGIPRARVGAPRPSPIHEPGPALGFALRAGAVVEVARLSHARPVTVRGAAEGLSVVRVAPDLVALARDDLGDLRVVAFDGRQWPYLLERGARTVRSQARLHRSTEGDLTTLEIVPRGALPIAAVVLETDERFVDRDFVLRGRRGDRTRVIARGRLSRRPDRRDPLRIAVDGERFDELALEIVDGADAPLAIERAVLEVPVPDLYLVAPDGEYRLLVGDAELAPPRYEIARARELALALRAAEVRPARVRPSPDHSPPFVSLPLSEIALWVVLVLAVLWLAWLSLRLAREPRPEETAGDDAPGAGTPPPTAVPPR